MLASEIDDLLSVLALMIFADKRVLDDEVRAFVRLADRLQVARAIEPRLSEAKLSVWYETHKDELKAVLERPNFEDWFYEKLDSLKSIPDKLPIMGVLCDIASSDGEVHVSERALVTLAAQRWGIGL